jgi:sugar lactone lactonase YvrE
MDVVTRSARRCSDDGLHLTLGEGPLWDPVGERLLWVDIAEGAVYQGRMEGDHLVVTDRLELGGTVGAAIPARDGGLVVAGTRHVHALDAAGAVTRSHWVIDDHVASRLNDAVCDPRGRLLVGTLALDGRQGQEAVLSIDPDGSVSTLVDGLTLANGMGFSPDEATFYLIDSIPGIVHAFEYDLDAGRVGARRVVWRSSGLVPDGLTVDREGHLWVAFFGAGQVHRIDTDGEVLEIVEVPAPNTTCPAFVGPSLDRLLITTAREQLDDEQLAAYPDSGGLFVVDVEARGLPIAAWGGSTMRQTVD